LDDPQFTFEGIQAAHDPCRIIAALMWQTDFNYFKMRKV